MTTSSSYVACRKCYQLIAITGDWPADLTISEHSCELSRAPARRVRYEFTGGKDVEGVIYVWPPNPNAIEPGIQTEVTRLRKRLEEEGLFGPCTFA